MKELQLDPLNAAGIQIADSFKHLLPRFMRKSKDDMNDHLNTAAAKLFYCPFKARERIAAADQLCCGLMDRLQTELDPDGLDTI